MNIEITLNPAKKLTIDVDNFEIKSVKDFFKKKKIIASIAGLPKDIILWEGEEEYANAGEWTNESVKTRALEIFQGGNVKFNSLIN
jgi:hypothetical protein